MGIVSRQKCKRVVYLLFHQRGAKNPGMMSQHCEKQKSQTFCMIAYCQYKINSVVLVLVLKDAYILSQTFGK